MAVRTGRRDLSWRDDQPATLVFAEALDGGDPKTEVEYRDALYQLKSPFDGEPELLLSLENRYEGVIWGDGEVAIAYGYWWDNRNIKAYLLNPSDPSKPVRIIEDRNYLDMYSDPGNFVTRRNEMGRSVLALKGGQALLIGGGYSE
jgi:hypothetical protein